jgi:DNA-binding response OmpR family regulator
VELEILFIITMQYKTLTIDSDRKLCLIDEEEIPLSKKEYELLTFLLEHPNYVHSRGTLIKEIWKSPTSLRTVDTTISRLRKKIKEYSSNITTRLGFGYCFNTK